MESKKIDGGYIMLARQIIESEIFKKPPLYLKVWVYLLARAQHDDYKKLKRGQLSTSIPEIQEAVSWKVGYRTETPSKNQIFRIINWLRFPNEACNERDNEQNMIETTKATHSMIITISNYEVYQDSKSYERNEEDSTSETTKAPRTRRHADNINKNVNNKDNNTMSSEDSEAEKVNYGALIKYLNEKTGRAFHNTEANKKLIKARLNDGFTKQDFKLVIDYKSAEWKENKEMQKYLRPNTLFAPSHFDDYLNEAKAYITSQSKTKTTSDGQRLGKSVKEIEAERAKHLKEIAEQARRRLNEYGD